MSEVVARRGHILNVEPPTTAALIMRRGRGAKRARHAARHERARGIRRASDTLGPASAPIRQNFRTSWKCVRRGR
eukprot:6644992-Pyramimonas_sp.AAC.1